MPKIFLLLIHNLIILWSRMYLNSFKFIDICFMAQFLICLGKCFVYIWKNEYCFKYSNEYSFKWVFKWILMGGMFCKHKLGPVGWWVIKSSILLLIFFLSFNQLLRGVWNFTVIVDLFISSYSCVTLCFMFFESLIRCINV